MPRQYRNLLENVQSSYGVRIENAEEELQRHKTYAEVRLIHAFLATSQSMLMLCGSMYWYQNCIDFAPTNR